MSISITTELLDGCVLALLTQENYYGYALTQRVQEFTPVSESTMYPVLRRLRKEKWLDTYDESFQGRNRRYYRITDTGKTRLTQIRADWTQYRATVDQILGGTTDGN
ncbi:PadR family transcriptional regulator [Paucilactobacillus hokkaidonensis JCM 18461]|uniref:PadR family transcriptional regulator n=2 Tax=Paucilactobacillus hokkaidonensis TaxID=1193095 RepID=A0A0A1GY48_9LACO|nr:PadR family transcriptional regulator [Paucilactobacillus hokkaidonensis]KRO10098.1 PadR family transcriptional regulator, regulatory protein PadR [Paucilactobacillus hokkaidonensis]BAP85391.1 PadR family transcriptional regulator [Paucilactobacillus hokkaidonensis JCM 18461]